MSTRGHLLVLWNQVEEDIYEKWREEGPKPLPWDPSRVVPDVGTVDEEMSGFIKALEAARFKVDLVNVEDDLERAIGAIRLYRPDAVFNLVEYFNDDQIQEAYIAGLFEMMNVPMTGNRPMTLATCQNKFRTKLILEAAGLPTADFFLAKKVPVPTDHELVYPLIVKPAFEDASGGIEQASVVQDHAALEARIAYVLKEFEMPALVEEYVDGREIHAAVIGNNPPEVLPLFEMEFDDSEFNPDEEWRPQIISYRAKWDPHSKEFYTMEAVVPPEDLAPELAAEITEIARQAFIAVGCRDYARIDMRIEDDDIYILEVNPNPDLVDGAAFMMCATASGRSYSDTLGAIADLAIARGRHAPPDPSKAAKPSDTLLREHADAKNAPAVAPKTEPTPAPAVETPLPEHTIPDAEMPVATVIEPLRTSPGSLADSSLGNVTLLDSRAVEASLESETTETTAPGANALADSAEVEMTVREAPKRPLHPRPSSDVDLPTQVDSVEDLDHPTVPDTD